MFLLLLGIKLAAELLEHTVTLYLTFEETTCFERLFNEMGKRSLHLIKILKDTYTGRGIFLIFVDITNFWCTYV